MTDDPRKVIEPFYDQASRLTELKVDSATQLSDISYNTFNQVTSLKTGAATSHPRVESYAYDSQTGLLTGQTVKNTAATETYLDLSYGYSRGNSKGTLSGKTGQMTHIIDNLDRNRDRKYEFDGIGRLLKAKGGLAAGATSVTANWTQEYGYDRYGNKTGVTASGVDQNNTTVPSDGLASLSFDSTNTNNRMTTSSGWIYDLSGNVIRGQNASGVWQRFEYDAAGRLKRVLDDSSNEIEVYTYGATRARLIKTTPTQRIYYAWGGSAVIAEYTEPIASSTPAYDKSYQYAGSRLVSTSRRTSSTTEATEFYHPGRLGTKLVTNHAAGTSFQQSTLPYGTAMPAESSGYTNQLFTSYDRSTSTGLDYAINRTYSSGQTRFTQVDPIGMVATSIGNPQSNNLYAYVQNMPTDFVDPTGLDLQQGIDAAFATLESSLCRGLFRGASSYPGRDPRLVLAAYIRAGLIGVGSQYDRFGEMSDFPSGDTGAITTLGYNTRGGVTLNGIRTAASQITINRNGFFFSLRTVSGSHVTNFPGFGGLSDSNVRGAVILHELAHAFGVIPTDGTNPAQSRRNSVRIQQLCFSRAASIFRSTLEPIVGGGGDISTEIVPRPYIAYPYPQWMIHMNEFLKWLYSIPIYQTDVRVIEEAE
jgi:RHS repeat-associated protein